jgi:electron transport complex protein RnfG
VVDKLEVSDIRDYRNGDSLKSIHWKLSSKSETFIVKDYNTGTSNQTVVFCDLTPHFPDEPPKQKATAEADEEAVFSADSRKKLTRAQRKAAKKAEQEAMTRVIAAADYRPQTTVMNESTYNYYNAVDAEGSTVGYSFTTSANGYGGEIKVMVGVDTKGVIAAIEVLDVSNETPGLGQNAGKKNFWEQFKGKSGEIGVAKNNPDKNEVQAMTGATITTTAVKNAVNKALSIYSNIAKEAGNNG